MASPSSVNPGNRLVTAGIEGPNRHRTVAGPAQHAVVGEILRLLVRQSCLPAKQKLGAHQADAVGILRIGVIEVLGPLDVDQQPYLLAIP